MFSKYKPMLNMWPYFWPQGHSLNKLGRDRQGDASYQILRGFREEDFFMFSKYKPM